MVKHISVLIKPASGLCNIKCQYCFYSDITSIREVKSYGKMSLKTMTRMIHQIFTDLSDGDELTLSFQGGEPTLVGFTFYEELTNLVDALCRKKKVAVHYAIQTNGTLINDRWCQLLKKHKFLVGLSIDGTPLHHDLHRLDMKGRGTFQRVIRTKKLFDHYEIDYNILCVLTESLAKEPKAVFDFIQKEKIQYIQFIPCLDGLRSHNKHDYSLTPESFSLFYIQLFDLWFERFHNGQYYSIKLFDDLFNLFIRREITACGITGRCQVQYVIEADGSVYPCDFYVLDEYRMGYIQEKTLKELFEQEISFAFLNEPKQYSDYCATCPFEHICCGGCKRMKDVMYVSKSGHFCGFQEVVGYFLQHLDDIVRIRQSYSVM
ncbi:radical SAM/SPASM domain-containing protein [Streptococcus pacificus]|uniref:SPASM domain-containing protein n=1 Tax=Streptococcus pacificus TaxID=2740577 RepID=A0ABS0ZIH6_9STRE|nr:SPASM domain-containing protein [Streptococcus pacificus]MBJ8325776.1 SPASM domain-containing protein [Streptococcus pacificus]